MSEPIDRLDSAEAGTAAENVRRILSYHRRTKHHPHRYAQAPDQLDWANQPDPFRTYHGAPQMPLPLLADTVTTAYDHLYHTGAIAPRPLDGNTVAILFELALGLSAWKQFRGSRWSLRCNPSSGNLHPTEGYAIVPALPGLEAGIHHYVSRDHLLERRCTFSAAAAARLAAELPPGSFLVGLSSIPWREAWKYGERAYRYCQHDVGHALAAVRYAAATLGWSARLLLGPGDAEVSAWLGIDRGEAFQGLSLLDREHPDCLMLVGPSGEAPALDWRSPPEGTWIGQANPLSRDHVRWEVLDVAAQAAWAPPESDAGRVEHPQRPPLSASSRLPAARLIRQRRSCLDLDGRTPLPATRFYAILDHLLPRPAAPPWDLLPWGPHIHAGIFVHRVAGLAPGLYFLERRPGVQEALRGASSADFRWEKPAGCPEALPLFLLREGDFRRTAGIISCHQDIAADGAFSLGMIAEFGDTIRQHGAWWYRRLFWEAGVLGHVLYLEAEAAGVRGTGIGCYFDDPFHELLGLAGDRFQSLYHFTIGTPVDDPRLQTLAPYAHLQRE